MTPEQARPTTVCQHPRLGQATVQASIGTMVRMTLASGKDYFAHAEDLRQWQVVPNPPTDKKPD